MPPRGGVYPAAGRRDRFPAARAPCSEAEHRVSPRYNPAYFVESKALARAKYMSAFHIGTCRRRVLFGVSTNAYENRHLHLAKSLHHVAAPPFARSDHVEIKLGRDH